VTLVVVCHHAETDGDLRDAVPAMRLSEQTGSTPHVIRYVSVHASTWPEYTRTGRTLDRSLVRSTSLQRPFNATAVNLVNLPSAVERRGDWTAAERPMWQWSNNSTAGKQLERPTRRITCGTR